MATLPMLYIIALIVGGGLILISTFLASHADADVTGDLDVDVGVDGQDTAGGAHHGAHGLSLTNWVSLQFFVYFLAIFGLIGTTLTWLAKATPGVALAVAVVGGLVVGQIVHHALRLLKGSEVGSDLTTADFVNRLGRVTVALDGTRRGEVAVASRNGERFIATVARRAEDSFKVGDRVVVVAFNNGVAEVVSQQEYEFVADTKAGVSP